MIAPSPNWTRRRCKLANRGEFRELPARVIVPNALYDRVTWSFTTNQPRRKLVPTGFQRRGVAEGNSADLARKERPEHWWEPPGTRTIFGCAGNSPWNRKTGATLQFQLHHDEDVEIYLNGVLAAQAASFSTQYFVTNINSAASATLKPGLNRMAVHCHQTTGGQYIDVGIVIVK